MMPFLYEPPTPHRCGLPWRELGAMDYDNTGARWRCDDCGKTWIYLPIPWERDWVPLRWWHKWTRPMCATGEEAGQ